MESGLGMRPQNGVRSGDEATEWNEGLGMRPQRTWG